MTDRACSCRSSARRGSRAERRRGQPPWYTRPALTHVFVAPHPDDVALSCGGLIASLRELGQNLTIVTVFSGSGSAVAGAPLTAYQREALGFGSKAVVTGDVTQIDLPSGARSGLIVVQEILKEISGIGIARLDGRDVVRHKIVQDIVEAYSVYSEGAAPDRARSH